MIGAVGVIGYLLLSKKEEPPQVDTEPDPSGGSVLDGKTINGEPPSGPAIVVDADAWALLDDQLRSEGIRLCAGNSGSWDAKSHTCRNLSQLGISVGFGASWEEIAHAVANAPAGWMSYDPARKILTMHAPWARDAMGEKRRHEATLKEVPIDTRVNYGVVIPKTVYGGVPEVFDTPVVVSGGRSR